MSLIINIRGCNGSGKTTLVSGLVSKFGVGVEFSHSQINNKIFGYELLRKKPLYVVGRYETACGGCDALPNFDFIQKAVRTLAQRGDVVFEGVLWSTVFKSSNDLAVSLANLQHQCIFALLNPPYEIVVDRILKRRAKKGNLKPFNPKKTVKAKHDGVPKTWQQLKNAGWDCRELPWENPLPTLLSWLDVSQSVEPHS